MLPSFRGDCLLVSGLLLSSALCQVKNNVMPRRAVCSLRPFVRLLHNSIKFLPYSRQLDTGVIMQSFFSNIIPRDTLTWTLLILSIGTMSLVNLGTYTVHLYCFPSVFCTDSISQKDKMVSKSSERKPQVTA